MELPYSQEGIILASDYFKDKDRILTVYAKDLGKIRAISRGSRSITSKLSPHLEILSYSNLMLFDGKALITVTRAAEIKRFGNMKNNLESAMAALYVADLLNRSTLEKLPDEKIFNLLLELFEYLDSKNDEKSNVCAIEEIVLAFKLKLLDILGLRPLEISEDYKEWARLIEIAFSDMKPELFGGSAQSPKKEKLGKTLDHSLEDMLNRQVISFSRYIC